MLVLTLRKRCEGKLDKMIKEDLIKELQKLPDGIEVNLFDHRMSSYNDCGESSNKGVYNDFNIEVMKIEGEEAEYYKEREGFEPKPWAALIFNNDDYLGSAVVNLPIGE